MITPFPEQAAREECLKLMEILDREQCVDFDLPPDLRDASLRTDYLWSEDRGQMFGVMICRDVLNGGVERVLKAFSARYNNHWTVEGWVPPCFDADVFTESENRYDGEIKRCTAAGDTVGAADLSRISTRAMINLYRFTGADGCSFTFGGLMGERLPQLGTGDCCEPKLLNYAYSHGLIPLSMATFYYGATNKSGTRVHKQFYPPCDERCGAILPDLLGLQILYRDDDIVVVNKPSGLLSVPGRGPDKQDCVVNRVRRLYPDCIEQPSVHRLDMDTSGLLVLGLTEDSHRLLNRQFETGLVHKEYLAHLSGDIRCEERNDPELRVVNQITERDEKGRPLAGHLELPFRLDPDNRPHQIFDPVYGKTGITDWKIECWRQKRAVVRLFPKTGRTHQLRLAASSPYGLGTPIYSDNLYGVPVDGEQLRLHAAILQFTHPISGEVLRFETQPDWL
ncbi:MAG: RluA family pseudouridine synthase [Treponemataceae bacterium]|nr:RluA family pseudouridine synthase [Treponemataceae bacterium]